MNSVKLNNKGFTLIELLVVIVILGFVVTFYSATITPVFVEKNQDLFDATAAKIAGYITSQYELLSIGGASDYFKEFCGEDGSQCYNQRVALTERIIVAAGAESENYNIGSLPGPDVSLTVAENTITASSIKILEDGSTCVVLHASDDGDFSNVKNKVAKSIYCELDN